MSAPRAEKRRAAASSSPLLDPELLHNVLGYVGAGHHLFCGTGQQMVESDVCCTGQSAAQSS
jgi:hypothetical protein